MSEAKGIWKWINETTPGLTWKKYKKNYWGAWLYSDHLELWPTKEKFRYQGNFYYNKQGYESLVGLAKDWKDSVGCWQWVGEKGVEETQLDLAKTLVGVGYLPPKVKSDGWETSYYDIPEGVKDIDDLIVHFGLNWHMANILKVCLRYGKKEGVTKEYDLNKIDFMLQRERKHLTNG